MTEQLAGNSGPLLDVVEVRCTRVHVIKNTYGHPGEGRGALSDWVVYRFAVHVLSIAPN